ncbi:hypothetical protein A5679_21905 [Mycobacterium scrofulaceum]|uniref:Uncharacterized protein n=1 Tax=Mycobacterium scrofulaceum TaxID=1783 RepID=A0A1A2V2G3_MYCSC|nr:hypothetical protein A5679_21905 [Mycobacterium scrofulaceum]
MDDENSGAFAEASAAPRASAVSGSSGADNGSEVAASSAGLISGMSMPEPTTNTPSGRVSSVSACDTMLASWATAASSSAGSGWRRTSAIDPSALLTTARVAVSGSMYSRAVCA